MAWAKAGSFASLGTADRRAFALAHCNQYKSERLYCQYKRSCHPLRLICAKRVLLSVAALLVLAMVLGRVGELAAKRGEQLATRIPRVQRPPNPDIKRARPRIPKEAKPGSSHKSADNDPPAGQPRRTHAAANAPASRPRRACGKDPPARQPAAAIPNGATWSRGRSPT